LLKEFNFPIKDAPKDVSSEAAEEVKAEEVKAEEVKAEEVKIEIEEKE